MTRTTRIALAVLLALPVATASARVVTCGSNGGQQAYCPADTRNGVTLHTQLSRSSCHQGSSWGYDDRGIWVANGCRAEFTLGDYRDDRGRSHSDGKAAAVLAVALIGAAIASSHHNKDQRRYQSPARNPNPWNEGYREPHADNGYVGGGYGYNGRPFDVVRCESQGGQWQRCPAMINRASVEVQRQLSRDACRHGRDWHYDGAAIYVQNGCRADFIIRP